MFVTTVFYKKKTCFNALSNYVSLLENVIYAINVSKHLGLNFFSSTIILDKTRIAI